MLANRPSIVTRSSLSRHPFITQSSPDRHPLISKLWITWGSVMLLLTDWEDFLHLATSDRRDTRVLWSRSGTPD